jgi:uncharacterized membrane protein
MEAMPQHDPLPPRTRPSDHERAAEAWARYKTTMKWMVLVAIVCILLSLVYLNSFGDPVPIHMMIATIAGVGLTILVGTGLMGLVFLSSRTGHDEEANRGDWNDDDRE